MKKSRKTYEGAMPLQAFKTENGRVVVDVVHLDDADRGTNRYRISPKQARGLAEVLVRLADEAERT